MHIDTCPVNKSDLTQADAYLARLSYKSFKILIALKFVLALHCKELLYVAVHGCEDDERFKMMEMRDPLSPDSLPWLGKSDIFRQQPQPFFLNSFENRCW